MKNTATKKYRVTQLNKGRIKDLSLFEKASLKIAGYIDGARGLPRKDSSGAWLSPRLAQEIHAFNEFSARIWGQLQIENEAAYAHLSQLLDSLVHMQTLLTDAKLELEKAITDEGMVETSRKRGETELAEAQVIARRISESAKKLAPLKTHVSALRSKLTCQIDEIALLRSRICQHEDSTRIICERVKHRVQMRISAYWNSALRKHPDSSQMPVAPCFEIEARAGIVYMEAHKTLMQKAELLSQSLLKDEKEVA